MSIEKLDGDRVAVCAESMDDLLKQYPYMHTHEFITQTIDSNSSGCGPVKAVCRICGYVPEPVHDYGLADMSPKSTDVQYEYKSFPELHQAMAHLTIQPTLVLAMPDWDKRRVTIVSDELIDGERLVCIAVEDSLKEVNTMLLGAIDRINQSNEQDAKLWRVSGAKLIDALQMCKHIVGSGDQLQQIFDALESAGVAP